MAVGGGLSETDVAWARDLAATMITAAVVVSGTEEDSEETFSAYAAARSQALTVETSDGLGADRFLATMFFLAAHAAGLLKQIGRMEGRGADTVWQEKLLRDQMRNR